MEINLIACVLGACLIFELMIASLALYQERKKRVHLEKMLDMAPKIRELVKGSKVIKI